GASGLGDPPCKGGPTPLRGKPPGRGLKGHPASPSRNPLPYASASLLLLEPGQQPARHFLRCGRLSVERQRVLSRGGVVSRACGRVSLGQLARGRAAVE